MQEEKKYRELKRNADVQKRLVELAQEEYEKSLVELYSPIEETRVRIRQLIEHSQNTRLEYEVLSEIFSLTAIQKIGYVKFNGKLSFGMNKPINFAFSSDLTLYISDGNSSLEFKFNKIYDSYCLEDGRVGLVLSNKTERITIYAEISPKFYDIDYNRKFREEEKEK